VVGRVFERIEKEARAQGVHTELLEASVGDEKGSFKSLLLAIEGEGLEAFCHRWNGSILWIGTSPFRPRHKRKNWFIGVSHLVPPEERMRSEQDFRVETMRASGPGGQHVNKTSSAVRVTHVPTGLVATAQEERSQHQNRKLAFARMDMLLQEKDRERGMAAQQTLWDLHNSLERGNPVRTFTGAAFIEMGL
jgi:peptide chain release factor